MNDEAFITCAITGEDTNAIQSPHCPLTPKQIATSVIAAAHAGAAIVRIRVRDLRSGCFSMDTVLYAEALKQIRDSKIDVIINLAGATGTHAGAGIGFGKAEDLVRPVIDLCYEGSYAPDIATLSCAQFTQIENRTQLSTPDHVREAARILRDLRVKPELEVFDTGNLELIKELIDEGLIADPALIQLHTGAANAVPTDTGHLVAMVHSLPANCIWTSFARGSMQMPWAAQSVLLGGHVRVGLEDNLYLSPGVYASNAQLVAQARTLLENMGIQILSTAQTRERLKLN